MSHVSGMQDFFREHGYELRRIAPNKWAYFDIEESYHPDGEPQKVSEGISPKEAGDDLLRKRFTA